ncbi:MAG: hypothetical protein KDA36_03645 [Planctomycetaceae bacterium]|nr:hypothetical protein [Planctomycetaceae bacterium]
MRKGLLFGLLAISTIGIGNWLSGETPAPPVNNALPNTQESSNAEQFSPEQRRIARLEQRIQQLEQRLAALEFHADRTNPDDEWKTRALGSRIVNGSRVYVLPLSRSAVRD